MICDLHTHSIFSDGTSTPAEIIDGAICAGLSAIALTDHKTTAASLKIADTLGLLKSGGSDFHGLRKPDIALGVGKGNLKIPYEWYLELKNTAK